MATVAENLQAIIDAKADIKSALIYKGQEAGDNITEYGELIRTIPEKKAVKIFELGSSIDSIKVGPVTEVYNVS